MIRELQEKSKGGRDGQKIQNQHFVSPVRVRRDLSFDRGGDQKKYGDVPNIELECHECMMKLEADVQEDDGPDNT